MPPAWLADRFRQSGPRYYLRHLGVLFMIVGAVASRPFRYYYAAAEIDGEGISFEGEDKQTGLRRR